MKSINIVELFRSIWVVKKKVVKWGAIGVIIGVIAAYSIPRQYASTVEIVTESESLGSSTLGSMSAMAGIMGVNLGTQSDGLSAELYPKVIKSAPYQAEFVSIPVVYNDKNISLYEYLLDNQKAAWWSYIFKSPMMFHGWIMSFSKDEELAIMADQGVQVDPKYPSSELFMFENALNESIKVTAEKKTGILTIKVSMQDPIIATQVADSVISKLQKYIIAYRTEKARTDLQFSEKLYKEAQSNYYKADSIYAQSSDRNQNLISKSAQMKVDRKENEKDMAFSLYNQMASQVEMNRVKLQEQTPIATVIQPARVNMIAVSPSKLKFLLGFAFLFAFIVVAKQALSYYKGLDSGSSEI